MKNKFFALVLAFVMAVGIMPVMNAKAEVIESGVCGENLTWELDGEGTLTISGTGDMYDFDGLTEGQAPWNGYFNEMNKVVIEEGVTGIGYNSFRYCDLSELRIPSTVTCINDPFFYGAVVSHIYYNGTYEEWCKIDVEENCDVFSYATFHFSDDAVRVFAKENIYYDGKTMDFMINAPRSSGNIMTATVVFSYDNTVVQPMSIYDESDVAMTDREAVEETVVAGGYCVNDYMSFSVIALDPVTIGNRTAIAATVYAECGHTFDAMDFDVGFLTFAFRYIDESKANEETFRLETETGEGTFLNAMFADEGERTAISGVSVDGDGERTYFKYTGTENVFVEFGGWTYTNSNVPADDEMDVLENSYFESADKTKFEIGFVTNSSICHTDFKTLKFGFTDGEGTTYMGYSMDELGLPVITSDDEESIMLGIIIKNIPIKFKDNVTLTLAKEELK